MPAKPSPRVLFALALVTADTLALQVVLTRLFSSVMAYHFSFLAISLALLGTGAGAMLVYLAPRWFDRMPLERLLARWCAIFGALLVVIPFALVRLDFSESFAVTAGFALNLSVACVLVALPSVAAGVVVALAIRGYTKWIGRVYAFDLVGAGLGALVVVPLLWVSDAPTLVVCLGVVALVAATLFALPVSRDRLAGVVLAAVGVGVVVASVTTSVLFLPPRFNLPADARQLSDDWTPLSRVIAYDFPQTSFAAVFYNRDYAPVPKVKGNQIPGWRELDTGPQSIGYELTGPGRTLVIGGGGGRDIDTALAAGQKQIDVIELNEGIRKVVDEDLANLSGSPYSRPGVSTAIGDGRSVLAARDRHYDVIHMGFAGTLSANAAAGFVLTENNLYTVDAFQEYFDHLTPRGVLDVSRIRTGGAGNEGVRLTVLVLASLERMGVEHPERNTVVVLGRDILGEETATVLARLRPYTESELQAIKRLANERGRGVVFAPGGPYKDEWKELADANGWRDFCTSYRMNVCPPTDDKPFFFNMNRLSQIGTNTARDAPADPSQILMLTLGILVVLSLAAFLLPLRLARERARPTVGSLIYFAAIGLGFLLIEVVLIQRFVLFLGFPTYALSVVLFAMLLFGGVGSSISSRFIKTRHALLLVLGGIALLTVVGAFGLQPLLRSLIALPFAARVALSIALIGPVSVGLGMAMPVGLRRFEAMHPTGVPYAWGVNGVASVVASVLGVALAINFGFAFTSLVAAACYLGASAHAAFGRWPEVSAAAPQAVTPEQLAEPEAAELAQG